MVGQLTNAGSRQSLLSRSLLTQPARQTGEAPDALPVEANGRQVRKGMALSEFYESTILKVGATFGFGDFACPPAEITTRLRIDPDEVIVKGEKTTLKGRVFERPFSSWGISSTCESRDVNDHLRQLLKRLEVVNVPFDPLWGEPSFGVLWKCNYLYAGTGPFYDPDVLQGISRYAAALYQDIYQVDEEDSGSIGKTGLKRIPKAWFFGGSKDAT